MPQSQLQQAITLIDSANAQDPNIEISSNGESIAKELLYGQRMSKSLHQFYPEASETLQIAARAQHVERWKSPRSDYPEGRAGYKKWRSQLYLFHASRAAELAKEAGYEKEVCERIAYLVQKRGLKRDNEAQALEDVVCLCFLQYYFLPFAKKHSDEKIIDIVKKTWAKMSKDGQDAALKLELDASLQPLIGAALQ